MSLLIIDESKCKKDGICARECGAALIRLAQNGFPETVAGAEAICMDCGHCVAICPQGALNHKRIPAENSPVISDALRIDEKQAEQFLRSRRSIRAYQAKPVEKEKIQKLIQVARYAPTAGNSQMVHWRVLTDRGQIRNLAETTVEWLRELIKNPQVAAATPYLPRIVAAWDAGFDTVMRNAPVVVVASAPREAMNGMVDLTLALSYLDLMAPALGLGTCWAGLLQGAMLNSPSIKAAVGIPVNHPHHYPMMLGYPDVKYLRAPERKAPKIVFA
jgi:nitroreductase/NAD-dependent dihydropyrimidine dehydrogenase PreA subunit